MTQNMLSTQYLFHCQGPRLPELHPLSPATSPAWHQQCFLACLGCFKSLGLNQETDRIQGNKGEIQGFFLIGRICCWTPLCYARALFTPHFARAHLTALAAAVTEADVSCPDPALKEPMRVEGTELKMSLLNLELCLAAKDHRGSSTNAAQWVWTPLVWAQSCCVPCSTKSLPFCQALGRICYTPRVRVCLVWCIGLIFSLHSLLKLGHLGHVWFRE